MAMLPRSEKRQSIRITKMIDATVERLGLALVKGQSRVVAALVVNVSREGVGLVAKESFDRLAKIRIAIHINVETGLPDADNPFKTDGEVRFCSLVGGGRGFRIGVQIEFRSGREAELWQELVRRWSSQML